MAAKKTATAKSAEKQQTVKARPPESANPAAAPVRNAAVKARPEQKVKQPKTKQQSKEDGNGSHPDAPPDGVLEARRKLHREIFDKCVEKKMMQEMDFWEP